MKQRVFTKVFCILTALLVPALADENVADNVVTFKVNTIYIIYF